MLEVIVLAMQLAQAEPTAEKARGRASYRVKKPETKPEPEEQWWVIPYEAPPAAATKDEDANFRQRWSPLEATPRGDRLDKD